MSASLPTVQAVFAARRPLGPDTNFFEAGFTSLLLTEVLAELRALGHDVTLVDLYRHATLRRLSEALHGGATTADRPPWQR